MVMSENVNSIKKKEKTVAGLFGAILFALIGAASWIAVYCFCNAAWICGILIAVLAFVGYRVFAKMWSFKGNVISIVVALLCVLATSFICFSIDVYVFQDELFAGSYGHKLNIFESMSAASKLLADPNYALAYLEQTALGIVFCLLGSVYFIVKAILKRKKEQ